MVCGWRHGQSLTGADDHVQGDHIDDQEQGEPIDDHVQGEYIDDHVQGDHIDDHGPDVGYKMIM